MLCFQNETTTNGEVSQDGKRERRRKRGFDIGPGDLGKKIMALSIHLSRAKR